MCYFNEEWLRNDRFKGWLTGDLLLATKTKCKFCLRSFNLSNMGIGGLVNHCSVKKHVKNMGNSMTCMFFKRSQTSELSTQSTADKKSEKISSLRETLGIESSKVMYILP